MPAALSVARPSSCASSITSSAAGPGAQIASTALARLESSFAYLKRMMSGRATELKSDSPSACAISSHTASRPSG